jgi:hypothetical protein
MSAPIYVVVASDDMGPYRQECPDEPRNPIVFETNVNGATLEAAQARCAQLEACGYGPCRIGRVVFEDEPGFAS